VLNNQQLNLLGHIFECASFDGENFGVSRSIWIIMEEMKQKDNFLLSQSEEN